MNFSQLNIQDLQLQHSIEVNPSSGSATVDINIPLSESRAGFRPSLSLQYSSSSRNSVYGIGWSMAGLPFISLDTSKGLPKYDGSDNYAFMGSKSLVPFIVEDGTNRKQRIDENNDYWIYYYRPKLEDNFTRFEKWVNKTDGSIHWRTRTKSNSLSVYGLEIAGGTKLFDPENKNKEFIWLLESQYDNYGNAINYQYKTEDSVGVDPFNTYETNRLNKFNRFGYAQKYPDKILYGNTKPIKPDAVIPNDNKWLFEIAFDYGNFIEKPFTNNVSGLDWKKREDPYSVYSPGFELRTYRLCQRILMYNHFDELSASSLVGILNCDYDEKESGTTLKSIFYTGVRRDLITGAYSEKNLPALKFTYTQPTLDNSFQGIVKETSENLPQGFDGLSTQIVDLFGEGVPGILTGSNSAWYYKPNFGNGVFGKQEVVISKPTHQTGPYVLGDFDQTGNLNFFSLQGRTAGYYEYDRDAEKWSGFTAFENIPQVNDAKFLDVNSDGLPDLIVEKEDKIVCYPFKGKEGFDKSYEFSKPVSNGVDYAPTIGNNLALDYYSSDMTGDGLPDQVKIINGRVEYFPNLGNGNFGEVVLMENPPIIDFDNSFDASRIRLFDLDGSGTSDILYIGNGEIRYWYNASGNKFIEGGSLTNLPYIDNISSAIILDFLGNGTPCLVWSNTLNHLQYSSVQYLELTNGIKPNLLVSLENSMGKEVRLEYNTSAAHFLRDKNSSSQWISKIPGHFTVVDKKITIDHISKTRFVSKYKYRDGHYDGRERRFVTFGLVEQYDTEFFENTDPSHEKDFAQPSCQKTWFHSGIFGSDVKRSKQYYNKDPKQSLLAPQSFESNKSFDSDEFLQAFQSLAGKIIRQETYATSAEGIIEEHPFQLTQTSYKIRKLQAKTKKHDPSFLSYQCESISIDYEQNPDDPKSAHHFAVSVDAYGDLEKELTIAYARRSGINGSEAAQKIDYISASTQKYIHTDHLNKYEIGILFEGKDFEINHLDRSPDSLLAMNDVQSSFDNLISHALEIDIPLAVGGSSQARLITWERAFFWNDTFSDVLPLGIVGNNTLSHHEESACFNNNLINQVYGGKVSNAMLTDIDEGNYEEREGYWWLRTSINHFLGEDGFFNLDKVELLNGSSTEYTYDDYFLNILEIQDPLGNIINGEIDYNLVAPHKMIDQNDNFSEVLYDALGVTIASFSQGTVLDESNTIQRYGGGLLSDFLDKSDKSFDKILANPKDYLQQADSYFFYELDNWEVENKPLRSISIAREDLIHDGKGNVGTNTNIQIGIDYIDGFGRTLQSKQMVEPGNAIKRLADNSIDLDAAGNPVQEEIDERWLVSGHVVYNNKQQPVRQFEPFFSSIIEFEKDEVLETFGVAAQIYYDALGRELRTDFPNGTFTELKITPWEIQSFDQNDTVDRSFYKIFREFQPTTNPERMALDKTLAHKETPAIIKFDPLGREIVQIQVNNDGTQRRVENRYEIGGNISEIIDARNLKAFVYKSDMLGRMLYENSMDAGEKWSFHNYLNQTIHLWDGRNIHQRIHYDDLDRATSVHIDGALGLNQITERFVYGEDSSLNNRKARNLRGQLVKHFDQAGILSVGQYTPSGIPLDSERKLLDQYTAEPDWTNPASIVLDADTYKSKYVYDALDRSLLQKLPDHSTRKYLYNQGGAVHKLLVSTADGALVDEEVIKETAHDAKGLRQRALFGNDVELKYDYDPETFRMTRLRSRKTVGAQRTYQDIQYTYDPVGNLVHFSDQAQQPGSAAPQVLEGLSVSAHSEFEYDALYQLKSAKGRVHQALLRHDYQDRSKESNVPNNWGKGTRHIALNNGAAVERYTREYAYDIAGNIKTIKHLGASQNWTKQIRTSPTSNRSLPLNDLNGNLLTNPEGRFDANGNCISMAHIRNIEWNYRNNIAKVVVIDRSAQNKPNDEEYYVYGGDAMRVRKITQRVVDLANDTIELTEKIYLNGCEIKRIIRNNQEILKRFSSHISDGTNKIALIHSWEVDTLARETDNIANKKIHFQLSNHLGSSSLELDESGDVITYEEYFPFGGTSFIAGRNKRDIDLKEYRYSGKERDDFTGLYYFGYRYYAHFIGGWLSPDPIGPEDSENLYMYVQNNPINLVDPNGLQSSRKLGGLPPNISYEEALSKINNQYVVYSGRKATVIKRDEKDKNFWIVIDDKEATKEEIESYRKNQDSGETEGQNGGNTSSGGTSATEGGYLDIDFTLDDAKDYGVDGGQEISGGFGDKIIELGGDEDEPGENDNEVEGGSPSGTNNGDGKGTPENGTSEKPSSGTGTKGKGTGGEKKGTDTETSIGSGGGHDGGFGKGKGDGKGDGTGKGKKGGKSTNPTKPGRTGGGVIGGGINGVEQGELGGKGDKPGGSLDGFDVGSATGTLDGVINGQGTDNSGESGKPNEIESDGFQDEGEIRDASVLDIAITAVAMLDDPTAPLTAGGESEGVPGGSGDTFSGWVAASIFIAAKILDFFTGKIAAGFAKGFKLVGSGVNKVYGAAAGVLKKSKNNVQDSLSRSQTLVHQIDDADLELRYLKDDDGFTKDELADFSSDPGMAKRLDVAMESDIGTYDQLQARGYGVKKDRYGRKFDNLDSDEAIQNVYWRNVLGLKRTDDKLKNNPSMALSGGKGGTHNKIKNFKSTDVPNMTPEQALQFHLDQLIGEVSDDAILMLRRDARLYIKKMGY